VKRPGLLADRRLAALLAAEVVSTTGAQMTWVALPWFVLVTTGSATKTTFVVAAEVIGQRVLGLPGGRLLGGSAGGRTMLLCDGVRAPLMTAIPSCTGPAVSRIRSCSWSRSRSARSSRLTWPRRS
jgi:hypothetical protein